MIYKVVNFEGETPNDLKTELMFELASARAEKCELVKLNVAHSDLTAKKNVSAVLKVLKGMKASGRIQFFATNESFETHSTEAVFLMNKYPDIFTNIPVNAENTTCFYVKL